MASIFQQNFYFQFEINYQNTNSFSSEIYKNNCDLNENYSKKMLKQKRRRNNKDKHEYENTIDQYDNDEYDYSQKSNSEYNKNINNFTLAKLKEDLMPK